MEDQFLREVAQLAEKRGYRVETTRNSVKIVYPRVPVLGLVVERTRGGARIELLEEDLRDYIDDLRETSGEEEAKELIEEVLDDLESLASSIEALGKTRGLRIENVVRRRVLDVLETLEDVLEG